MTMTEGVDAADEMKTPSSIHQSNDRQNNRRTKPIMKPIGYYASARYNNPDAAILDRITEEFGDRLTELTNDDKAAVLICLVEKASDTQQVVIQDNFFSDQNGGDLWHLAQNLSPMSQLTLAQAILCQLIDGGLN